MKIMIIFKKLRDKIHQIYCRMNQIYCRIVYKKDSIYGMTRREVHTKYFGEKYALQFEKNYSFMPCYGGKPDPIPVKPRVLTKKEINAKAKKEKNAEKLKRKLEKAEMKKVRLLRKDGPFVDNKAKIDWDHYEETTAETIIQDPQKDFETIFQPIRSDVETTIQYPSINVETIKKRKL